MALNTRDEGGSVDAVPYVLKRRKRLFHSPAANSNNVDVICKTKKHVRACDDGSVSLHTRSPDSIFKGVVVKEGDLHKAVLCRTCWDQLSSFHQFYVSVQQCHENRQVLLDVKSVPESVEYYQIVDWEEGLKTHDDNGDEIEYYRLEESVECSITSDDTDDADTAQPDERIKQKSSDVTSHSEEVKCNQLEVLVEFSPEQSGKTIGAATEQQNVVFDSPKSVQEKMQLKRHVDEVKQDFQHISDDDYIRKHVVFICEHCQYEGDTFSNYAEHCRVVHCKKYAYLTCCGSKFYTKSHLLKHVQMVNDPNLLHNHNSFLKQLKYKRIKPHVTPRPKLTPGEHYCNICTNHYSNLQDLKEHVAAFHDKVISHKCLCCEFIVNDVDLLNCHVKKYHPNEHLKALFIKYAAK